MHQQKVFWIRHTSNMKPIDVPFDLCVGILFLLLNCLMIFVKRFLASSFPSDFCCSCFLSLYLFSESFSLLSAVNCSKA